MGGTVMSVEQFLEKYTAVQEGEIILFTAGEYESHGGFALARILKDAKLSDWADQYIETHGINEWNPEKCFHCGDFIKFLEMHGVIESIPYREVHVVNDNGCAINTPKPDSYVDESESAHQPMRYESEEIAFDPTLKS